MGHFDTHFLLIFSPNRFCEKTVLLLLRVYPKGHHLDFLKKKTKILNLLILFISNYHIYEISIKT